MSKYIFRLIKTLNKTEKSRFTESLRQTKRLRHYKKLLAKYGAAESYNSDLDKLIFKDLSNRLMYDCKAHFKERLNSFLISNKRVTSTHQTIRRNFEIGTMLVNRQMYDESYKVFKKTYKLAKDCHDFLYAVMLGERVMFLEKRDDLTRYRVDEKNIRARHLAHMKDVEDYLDYRKEYHLLWENLGKYHVKQGLKKYERPQVSHSSTPSFRLKFIIAQKLFCESQVSDDYELQLEKLEHLIKTVSENKDAVQLNSRIKVNYYPYLSRYMDLCVRHDKTEGFELIFAEFDSLLPANSQEYNVATKCKVMCACLQAIYLGQAERIAAIEAEFLSRKIFKKDFLATSCYVRLLSVHFIAGNIDKCKDYLKKLDKISLRPVTLTVIELMKIITAIEGREMIYADSLLGAFFNRSEQLDKSPFVKSYIKCLKHLAAGKMTSYKEACQTHFAKYPQSADYYSLIDIYLANKAGIERDTSSPLVV